MPDTGEILQIVFNPGFAFLDSCIVQGAKFSALDCALASVDLVVTATGLAKVTLSITRTGTRVTRSIWSRTGARGAAGGLDDLSRAAGAVDRNGLTAAERAAQKHGNRSGSGFPLAPDRTASGYNQLGQDLVDDLLKASNTAVRSYVHPWYGQVTEYIGPQYGARWGPNGEFLGFL